MGLALAAELNNYPGPLHVLELAEGLHLSAEQRARTQALIDAMKAESIRLGERLLAQEAELDRLFAERRVTRESLEAATSRIGVLQGELRATHLRYHLTMAEMLSPAQVARYAELRGYSAGGGHSGKH
ncbi:MAG: periplasmic heavy metal sensor [Alphaproteobacteria bacterium]|nr:periplasmic heavy metal sensor [Alphaproteobacteria bacterium]